MKINLLIISLLHIFLGTAPKSVMAGDGEVLKITTAQFKELIMNYEKNPKVWTFEGKLPCIVDFYADWCGPCRMASPALEELAMKYKGKIVVYKVNTDQERELSAVFGISGIPAFLYVPTSGNPTMTSGVARTPQEIKDAFEKMINGFLLKM
ncbi:MAG: thioredoxin domain-containing protein [Mariniphaga sp.]